MANLNIPFLLLQPSICSFSPNLTSSKIIPYHKYNFRPINPIYKATLNTGAGNRKTHGNMHQTQDIHHSSQHQSNFKSELLSSHITQTGFDPTKLSTFDDNSPKNLVVLSDSKSGNIILCNQEHYLSTKKEETGLVKQKRVTKFLVNLIPRVALIPSISEEAGPLLDQCLVRSPAPNILSTSAYFLVTLHSDNRIRLWNTNDGRCVLASQREMLVSKAVKIKDLKNHPGNILVIGKNQDVYIVNIYKMMIYKHFHQDMEGCVKIFFREKHLVMGDKKGKIYIWKDDSEATPIKNYNNSTLFELSNSADDYETFEYSLQTAIGEEEDIQNNKMLAFNYINEDQVFVISAFRVDFYWQKTRKSIFQFSESNRIVFGKFITIHERVMIVLVDAQLNLYIFDQTKLKHEVQAHSNQKPSISDTALVSLNLIRDSKFFEHNLIKHDDQNNLLRDSDLIKKEFIQDMEMQIRALFREESDSANFKFCKTEKLLYTFIQVNGESKMVSWSLATLIENLDYSTDISRDYKIPLFTNEINMFPEIVPNCPINFYSLVIKSIYNKHQFQFFFADESVKTSVIYTSVEQPSLIIGTNYGRIFIVPMFQENEKISPILLIDTHRQSPITQLFIAYDSCRKIKQNPSFSKRNINNNPKDSLLENGGHLISTSEDGTIAITNLNSLEIQRTVHNFNLNDVKSSRGDKVMSEVNSNRKNKRRNSVTNCFNMNQFYYMAKVKSQMVYYNSTFGNIETIFEVKSLQKLQEKIVGNRGPKKQSLSPDKRSEDEQVNGKRRGSFQASPFYEDNLLSQNPQYACLSSDGVVAILQLSNLTSSLTKLHGLDSKAIGIYSNDDMNQYYVLTDKLNFFIYNKKSCVLERRADFKFALNSLYIRETLEYLLQKNESLRYASKKEQNVFEYESFERIFKRKSLLMGLGSHKILDYLGLSLSLPLKYHPHNIYSNKYTKILWNLLQVKDHISDFGKKEESQKELLRVVNDSFFYNNLQFKSDFKEEYFNLQTGVTCMETKQTIFNAKQQLIMTSSKHMMHVMGMKYQKVKNRAAGAQGSNFQIQKMKNQPKGEQFEVFDDNGEEMKNDLLESQNIPMQKMATTPRDRVTKFVKRETQVVKPESDGIAQVKWPNRLLALIHPFNIDTYVDELVETQLGLNLPFLDFRLGIQGADESFSFIISKEDEDYHSERNNITKLMRQLKLSRYQKKYRKYNVNERKDLALEFNESDYEVEGPVRFFGSEQWKVSSYISTIFPSFFLQSLVSIVEYSLTDITELIQEWLFILSKINQQKTLQNHNTISLSVVSKLLLKKDPNISSTARDIIMKPILYTIDTEHLFDLIDEWAQLILETYKKLKKESSIRQAYGGQSAANQMQQANFSSKGDQNQDRLNQIQQTIAGNQTDKKQINQYFGELEIRGLVNVSNFALYYIQQLDPNLQYRVSKLTTILTREIVQKFTQNKRYIHLLVLLLQILGIWMKSMDKKSTNKALINEVIKLLLYIYNLNKSPLNREHVITRVTAENFHLIKPTVPELYLKLTAARALLEIGENFTNDFLQIIQDESTQLTQGLDYQQNVLEILKFFINSYGENMENHLIQLTQILLKCLDPNELALRKNSHKIISLILSIMVKMFPMVAFHHESQRLAVGTHDGPIAIYDVRTSAKWKILEGHSGNVTCLSFDSKGNLLASYSAKDCTLRLWKVGNTGFFSTIMGGTGKSSNTINLEKIKNVMNPHELIERRKQQSLNQSDIRGTNNLLEENNQNNGAGEKNQGSQGSKRINKCTVKFVMPKEKYVELTREDGRISTHKLVK